MIDTMATAFGGVSWLLLVHDVKRKNSGGTFRAKVHRVHMVYAIRPTVAKATLYGGVEASRWNWYDSEVCSEPANQRKLPRADVLIFIIPVQADDLEIAGVLLHLFRPLLRQQAS